MRGGVWRPCRKDPSMDKLLKVMEGNARLSLEEIAAMTGQGVEATANRIDAYHKAGVLRGTRTLIDWDKVGGCGVCAMIDVRVAPRKDCGFDVAAEAISQMEEVDSVLLMSGGYDLSVTVKGMSLQEVAAFVAQRLSTLDDVLSTTTHFVLRTYKKEGALFGAAE